MWLARAIIKCTKIQILTTKFLVFFFQSQITMSLWFGAIIWKVHSLIFLLSAICFLFYLHSCYSVPNYFQWFFLHFSCLFPLYLRFIYDAPFIDYLILLHNLKHWITIQDFQNFSFKWKSFEKFFNDKFILELFSTILKYCFWRDYS